MTPEEPASSLLESTSRTTTRSAARSPDEATDEDEASTRPMADLPLFHPSEITGDSQPTRPADGADERTDEPVSAAETRPVEAGKDSPQVRSDRDHGATVSASLGNRLVAAALDLLALALLLGLLVGVSAAMGIEVRLDDLPFYLPTWLAFGFFYQVLPLLFWGRTPGMAWAGIESRDDDGEPLTLQQAALRWLAGLVTWLLLGLPGLLAVTGRSLTDRLSGSRTFASI